MLRAAREGASPISSFLSRPSFIPRFIRGVYEIATIRTAYGRKILLSVHKSGSWLELWMGQGARQTCQVFISILSPSIQLHLGMSQLGIQNSGSSHIWQFVVGSESRRSALIVNNRVPSTSYLRHSESSYKIVPLPLNRARKRTGPCFSWTLHLTRTCLQNTMHPPPPPPPRTSRRFQ
jgi:hypothetical protein